MRVPLVALACLALAGCGKSGLAHPTADAAVAPSASDPTRQWVYVNDCRALADFFLVTEGPDTCVIATFADRFPPAEGATATAVADVTRGPAPCPEPGDTVAGYPDARTTLEVQVRRQDGVFSALLGGEFPDGTPLDVQFRSADRRSCCACWGRAWPAP